MRKILMLGLVLAVVLVVGGGSAALAQEAARAKLLGVWQGMLRFGTTAPATMEFFEDGGVLKWKCSFSTSSKILWGDAEGTVTTLALPKVEARGVYTKHSVPGGAGTGVTFALTLDGDQLNGQATADMNQIATAVTLTRKK